MFKILDICPQLAKFSFCWVIVKYTTFASNYEDLQLNWFKLLYLKFASKLLGIIIHID